MSIGSSEHYSSRAAEVDAAIAHLHLPVLERNSDTAMRLALGADDDEVLDFPGMLLELLGEFARNARDLSAVVASELTPRERHDRLLRNAEAAASKGRLEEARELAAIARLWAQAIIEFPAEPKAARS